MEPLTFESPTSVRFGAGRRHELPEILAEWRINRALVLCSPRFSQTDVYAELQAACSSRIAASFTDIPPHSGIGVVEQAAELAGEHEVDGYIAIGGGSVIDSAKWIAVLHAEGGRCRDHAMRYTPPDSFTVPELPSPKAPIIAVPTTAGSAAEVNAGGGVADVEAGDKIGCFDHKVTPRVAILDPELTVSMDAELTATTGINAFAHCVETIYSRTRQPFATALSLHAIHLMRRFLPVCVESPTDLEARGYQQIATAMSGIALSNAFVGVHHGLCHALGVRAGLPHGVANAVILPHALNFNAAHVEPELCEIGRAMALDDLETGQEGAQRTIAAIAGFIRELGAPFRLRDVGVPEQSIPELGAIAYSNVTMHFNPRPIQSEAELAAIYQSAW